jgi:hypothetical protein
MAPDTNEISIAKLKLMANPAADVRAMSSGWWRSNGASASPSGGANPHVAPTSAAQRIVQQLTELMIPTTLVISNGPKKQIGPSSALNFVRGEQEQQGCWNLTQIQRRQSCADELRMPMSGQIDGQNSIDAEKGADDARQDQSDAPIEPAVPVRKPSQRLPKTLSGSLKTPNHQARIYPLVEHAVAALLSYGRFLVNESALAEHFSVSRTVAHEVRMASEADMTAKPDVAEAPRIASIPKAIDPLADLVATIARGERRVWLVEWRGFKLMVIVA